MVHVTALFRHDLVFDMNRRNSRSFIFAHRANYVERIAVTRIRVRDYGNVDDLRDTARVSTISAIPSSPTSGRPSSDAELPNPVM